MTITVTPVLANQCQYMWPQVKDLLDPAIRASHGRWKNEYVLVALVTGRQTLWVICQDDEEIIGALTTEVIFYPEKKMVMIHFLGGNGIEEWYQIMSDAISDYAATTGCEGIECIARSGFWKWFKPDGFERTAVFYEKVVV